MVQMGIAAAVVLVSLWANYMIQVPPEDAISNTHRWLSAANLFTPPEWLRPENTDMIVSRAARIGILCGIIYFGWAIRLFMRDGWTKTETVSSRPIIAAEDIKRAEERQIWLEKGGDSFPYLVPELRDNKIEFYIRRMGNTPLHLSYGEEVTDDDSKNQRTVIPPNLLRDIPDGGVFLGEMKYPEGKELRAKFAFIGLNGNFDETIRFIRAGDRWECGWDVRSSTTTDFLLRGICP